MRAFSVLIACAMVMAVAVAVAVAVALAPVAAAGGRSAAVPCRSAIDRGSLPVWARTGFTPPTTRIPHVLGRSGRIVAILFGDPLVSPPSRTRNNKILWVSHAPLRGRSDLRISAQRIVAGRPAGRVVKRVVRNAPGPSIIDLPAAGCWRLTLAWSGTTDRLDLVYHRSGG